MTPETREVLNQVLDQYYGNLIDTIAQGRRKDAVAVKAIVDQGPVSGDEALSNGLVDSLGYEEQAVENLKNRAKRQDLKRVSGKSYLKATVPTSGSASRIALVVGEGEITAGSGNETATDQGFTATGFIKLLKQVEDDSSIKAVIMRIDSPGGDGTASDDILHEARNLSRKKPLVISMSDLAASGGYFVSVTGDPIVAYPNTLTGSIGVIFARFNLHGTYDKLGIGKQLLTRGRYRDARFRIRASGRRPAGRKSPSRSTPSTKRSSTAWPKAASAPSPKSSRWRRGACGWARKPSRTDWSTN